MKTTEAFEFDASECNFIEDLYSKLPLPCLGAAYDRVYLRRLEAVLSDISEGVHLDPYDYAELQYLLKNIHAKSQEPE